MSNNLYEHAHDQVLTRIEENRVMLMSNPYSWAYRWALMSAHEHILFYEKFVGWGLDEGAK